MKVCFLSTGPFVDEIKRFPPITTLIAQGQIEFTENRLEANVLVTDSAMAYSHERLANDVRTFVFVSNKPQTVVRGTYVGNISDVQDFLCRFQLK